MQIRDIETEERQAGHSFLKKAFAPALPATVILLNLTLVMPATIFSGNPAEFDVGLRQILQCYVWPAMGLLLLVMLLSALVSEGSRQRLAVGACAVGTLLWVQGNFLVWPYGLLNGHSIDWTQNVWRGWIDGALWIAVIALCVFYARRWFRAVSVVSIAVIAAQGASVAVLTMQGAPWLQVIEAGALNPPREIFAFGARNNILHLVLDAFQADLFDEIVSQDPPYWEKELDGFVFYENTSGVFATTYMSVPAFLTGHDLCQ